LLVQEVYSDFAKTTPSEYDFGFHNQIQRAAVSIMNNIAEGFERSTNPDFVRFLDIVKASCGEVRSMYYTAEDLSYVLNEVALERRNKAKQLSAGIAKLQSHLRSR